MKKLNLPEYNFIIREDDNTRYILDKRRKKELVLTPEEWVRQNLLQFLIKEKLYPEGLISVEAGIKLNTLQKRYDALVYGRDGNPLVLIECKAPEVPITKKVFDQILNYNSQINAPFLLVSNGMNHYFLCKDEQGTFKFMNEMPEYNSLEI